MIINHSKTNLHNLHRLSRKMSWQAITTLRKLAQLLGTTIAAHALRFYPLPSTAEVWKQPNCIRIILHGAEVQVNAEMKDDITVDYQMCQVKWEDISIYDLTIESDTS